MNIYQLIDNARLQRINDGNSYIYRLEITLREEVRVFKKDMSLLYKGRCKKKKDEILRENMKRNVMINTFSRAWSFSDRLV